MKQKKSFLKVPTPIDGFNTDSAKPRSTTSREASLVWEEVYDLGRSEPCMGRCEFDEIYFGRCLVSPIIQYWRGLFFL